MQTTGMPACCAAVQADCIELTGVQGYGHHGVFAAEKELGQWFLVDLVAWLDLQSAGQSDAVTDTVHYGELANLAQSILTGPPFDLVEKVAQEIAVQALRTFPLLQAITVRVHKPQAPITVPFQDVAVVVHRHAADLPPGA